MPRLTLRPLDSFLGVDLKLGASVISLLGLLNKIAGVYGILAVFTGGSVAQVSLYVYSIATLVLFLWGLRGIASESASTTFLYAHLYALDHFISTTYTVFFGVRWWNFVPHDGQRLANSPAQQAILDEARHAGVGSGLDPTQAKLAAEAKWDEEKGFSFFVLAAAWMIKIFFMICLYSFAMHVRRGSYRALPASKASVAATATAPAQGSSPFRRRGSNYAYSHLRNISTTSDYELSSSAGTPAGTIGKDGGSNGLEDVLEPRTPTSPSAATSAIPRTELQPPSPMDVPTAGAGVSYPGGTSRSGAKSPVLMRTRSTGGEER